MNGLAIRPTTALSLVRVQEFERQNLEREQVPITTHHLIHAGMYARSITIPAGVALTGALIKIATILVVSGDVTVATGEDSVRLVGTHVIPASAHRKQAFLAHEDTHLTMLFPTKARDTGSAEREFTDEFERLFSNQFQNVINITED